MKSLTATQAWMISKSTTSKNINLKRINQCVRKCLKTIKKEAKKGIFQTEIVFDKFLISKEEKSNIMWEISQLGYKVEISHNERHHTIFNISWNLMVDIKSVNSVT